MKFKKGDKVSCRFGFGEIVSTEECRAWVKAWRKAKDGWEEDMQK